MMEYYELVKNWAFTGTLGIFTYWIPLILCIIGFSTITFKQIRSIILYNRKPSAGIYVSDLSLGNVLWMAILAVTPIINVLVLFFVIGGDMFRQVVDCIGAILDLKIVKKKST